MASREPPCSGGVRHEVGAGGPTWRGRDATWRLTTRSVRTSPKDTKPMETGSSFQPRSSSNTTSASCCSIKSSTCGQGRWSGAGACAWTLAAVTQAAARCDDARYVRMGRPGDGRRGGPCWSAPGRVCGPPASAPAAPTQPKQRVRFRCTPGTKLAPVVLKWLNAARTFREVELLVALHASDPTRARPRKPPHAPRG